MIQKCSKLISVRLGKMDSGLWVSPSAIVPKCYRAELISKLYRLRWMIELFFRTIKSMLHCNHLLITKQNAISAPSEQ